MKLFDSVHDTITSIAETYYISTLYVYSLNRHSRSKLRYFGRYHFHAYISYFFIFSS